MLYAQKASMKRKLKWRLSMMILDLSYLLGLIIKYEDAAINIRALPMLRNGRAEGGLG